MSGWVIAGVVVIAGFVVLLVIGIYQELRRPK